MTTTITIYNNKGGSGKTLVVVNIAACLALMGYKVLVIDSDSQSDSSAYLLPQDQSGTIIKPDLGDVYNMTELTLPYHQTSIHPKLFVTPSSAGLELMDRQMFCRGEKEYLILKHALESVKKEFDYILIDTPPSSRSVLGYNAMIASNYVLTPVDVDGSGGLRALPKVLEFVNEVQSLHNNRLVWLGLVLNKCKKNWSTEEITLQTKEYLTGVDLTKSMFKQTIKYMDRYGNSSINHNPIVFAEPNGIGTEEFRGLTKELLKRLK